MWRSLFPLILLTPALFCAESQDKVVVTLKEPQFFEGIVSTSKGGVIEGPSLRIQAKNIAYTHKISEGKTVQNIKAEGDLMMNYLDYTFAGEALDFDLETCTGILLQGRAGVGVWFFGGEKIELTRDLSKQEGGEHPLLLSFEQGFLTMCTSIDSPWGIEMKRVGITQDHQLSAQDIRFQILHIPVLWLPVYKMNLDRFLSDSPIHYKILWDKGLGPRLSMRYRIYSTETFSAFARFDFRVGPDRGTSWRHVRGQPGGALEAAYISADQKTSFKTRNYAALDRTFPVERKGTHYRFQGIIKSANKTDMTRLHIQWDKLSDKEMVDTFPIYTDFELKTEKTTYLDFFHYNSFTFAAATVRPSINPAFQSLNQKIPYLAAGIRPFSFWKSGIIMENNVYGSYLDYLFATQVKKGDVGPLNESLFDPRKSGRIQTTNTLYRPFHLKGCSLTPKAGLVGIYYSNNPLHQSARQLTYTYGAELCCPFYKYYTSHKHNVNAYANYMAYTTPQLPLPAHYIFDITDGYSKLQQVRFGIKQSLFARHTSPLPAFSPLPTFSCDVYSYGFWSARSFHQTIPKIFADLEFNQPSYAVKGALYWNLQEQTLDVGNIGLLWTLNASFAWGIEFRHRSKYWWRKASPFNFMMDSAISLPLLLESPISDQRSTLLIKAHCRITPRWNVQLETRHGWGRLSQPRYNAAKIDFYTMLNGGWQLQFSYEYLPDDPFRTFFAYKLVK